MALIDLKSNLKDLSFVDPNFRNTTGAPYVYKDHTDYEANPSKLKASNEIQARIDETVRIAKLLIDTPGIQFAGKQAAILAAKNLLEDGIKGLVDIPLEVASLLTSTVAQFPVNGTGVHFDKYELYSSKYYIGKPGYHNALYGREINITAFNTRGQKSLDFDYNLSTNGSIDKITEDTVPVSFHPIGDTGVPLVFRGFINNVSDNTSPNFNPYNFVGRGEPVFTYTSTARTLGFSLQVPIFNEDEQSKVYRKANRLISFGYPKYNEYNLPEGTVVKVTIGDLYNLHGVLTSINHSIDTNVPWSSPVNIGKDGKEKKEMLLPQVLNFTINLNIIHNQLPQRNLESGFITKEPIKLLPVEALPLETLPPELQNIYDPGTIIA